MSNTLLNYFKKTPAKTPAKSDALDEDKENNASNKKVQSKSIPKMEIDDDDEDIKRPIRPIQNSVIVYNSVSELNIS